MSSTHNIKTLPMPFSPYDQLSNFSTPPFSSSHSDLLDFHCINIAQPSHFLMEENRCDCDGSGDHSVYPSPPHTSSISKRSVPLPKLVIDEGLAHPGPIPLAGHIGGILDSPIVRHHVFSNAATPLSPPPTLPTPTSALPPAEGVEADFLPFLGCRDFAPSTCYPAAAIPQTQQALLSPLSPELGHHSIAGIDTPASSDDSVLLSEDILPPSLGLRPLQGASVDCHELWKPDTSYLPVDVDVSMNSPPPHYPPLFSGDISFESPTPHPSPFPHPSSPLIHPSLSYDEMFDDLDMPESPESPSLRSFSPLPSLDMELDDSDEETLITPQSPSSTLLSLPGAESDDEFPPLDLSYSHDFTNSRTDAEAPSPSSPSLLLLDDVNDVPTPRSPSPDNFDLDPSLIAGCSDPDLQKLIEMRKKAQVAEKSAKQLEQKMLDEGVVGITRTEARKTRKKEKMRCKEISAMLKLRLGEKGVMPLLSGSGEHEDDTLVPSLSPTTSPKRAKKVISSMAQLVARMMFRRRETERSMVHAVPPSIDNIRVHHTRSPLWQSWSLAELEKEEEEDGDDDDDDEDIGVDLNLKGFGDYDDYEPSSWTMMVDSPGFSVGGVGGMKRSSDS